MVFSSLSFILFFLPAVTAVYYLLPRTWRSARNVWLLLASLAFYTFAGLAFLPILLAYIALSYVCGLMAAPEIKNKALRLAGLLISVIGSAAMLGYYKYTGFLTENLAALGLSVEIAKIAMPMGISFFTFQGISYVVDVYKGKTRAQRNPLNVALYLALFPQLVSGPIVRYGTVAESMGSRKETPEDISAGLTRFCFGLGKKMLLANPMGEVADAVFQHAASTLPAGLAWLGMLSYSLQLYLDFSSYSDMALGLGRMFGFHFLENFNYPYISRSVGEFWTRWHISLSSWFKDYIYIPLGGSRRGKLKQLRNIFIVWLLTGIWHGAAWNYVFWGMWFFIFLAGEKFVWGKALSKAPSVLRWGVTMLIVLLGRIIFRADSLGYALDYFTSLLGFGSGIDPDAAIYYLKEYWIEWVFAIIACVPLKGHIEAFLSARSEKSLCRFVLTWAPKGLALLLLALSYMELVGGSVNSFIYFQF